MYSNYCTKQWFVCLLFHLITAFVLQLKPETVAVRRLMTNGLDDYDGQIVSEIKCVLNYLRFRQYGLMGIEGM